MDNDNDNDDHDNRNRNHDSIDDDRNERVISPEIVEFECPGVRDVDECVCLQNAAREPKIMSVAREKLTAGQSVQVSVQGLGPSLPRTCPHRHPGDRVHFVRVSLESPAMRQPVDAYAEVRGGFAGPLIWDFVFADARTRKTLPAVFTVYDETTFHGVPRTPVILGTIEIEWDVHPSLPWYKRLWYRWLDAREDRASQCAARALFGSGSPGREWWSLVDVAPDVIRAGISFEELQNTLESWIRRGWLDGRWAPLPVERRPEPEFRLTPLGIRFFGPGFTDDDSGPEGDAVNENIC